jgi:hypothetical protein
MVREAAVDEVLSPQDSIELSVNLHFDRIGAVTLRQGVALLGAQITAGTPILGMTNYRNNAGTVFQALAMIGTTVKAYAGSSWSSVRTGLVSGSRARFTSLVDYVFMVNGHSNDVLASYSGSGSFGSTNVADLPKGDYIENYRNRIWVADSSVDKVYYTDVVNINNTITGGTSFIQISPNDGESITALKRHPRALLVFKQNHIYRVFSINSTDPDPSITRGTYSQESVIEAKDGIYYHHPSGFYQFVFDGEQKEISRPIIDFVQAIPRAYYSKVNGWVDDDHLYWSIGDVTVGGILFSNAICCYTLSTQVWTVYTYASEVRSSALYDSGTTLTQILGDDNGNILTFNSGTTDNSTPIYYDLRTHWYYLTDVQANAKTFTELVTMHENAEGAGISYQLDSSSPYEWTAIADIRRAIFQVDRLNASNFARIRFRLSGSSSGTPFIFRGWELLNVVANDIPRV